MSVNDIADAVELVLPQRRPIGHHEPQVDGKEAAYVMQAIIDGVQQDKWVKRFEKLLAGYCGTTQALGVASGTSALHLALLAVGVKPGEEVIVPSLTFAATANAVCHAGATPNFVDGTIGINAFKLRRYLERHTKPVPGRRGRLNCKTERVISALIVVDLLGFPADMTGLCSIAEDFGLTLIEDAAQALGSTIGNRRCGSYGAVSTHSFNNNKVVTGNGGGALTSNDEWIIARAWQLATTARTSHPWLIEHDTVAFNYRLPAINAALATAQLERIEEFLGAKRQLLARYRGALGHCPELEILETKEPWQGQPNYWLITAMLKPGFADLRNPILEELHKRGIRARALFTPLHLLPMFADCPRSPNMQYCEATAANAICLPSGASPCVV